MATLLVLLGMERVWPHSPAPLVAVGGAIAASWLFGLGAQGVATVGLIPQGFPSLTMPDLAMVRQLVPGALGIALMSFTESIAAGRAFARPGDPPMKPNRELLATGAANLAGAFLGAMPAGGGTSQTAVVRAAEGGRRRLRWSRPGRPLATMLLLAPLLGLLPHATLAAVVIVYSVGLIQPAEFRGDPPRTQDGVPLGGGGLPRRAGVRHAEGHRRRDHRVLIGLASQAANPQVYVIGRKPAPSAPPASPEHPEDETFEGLLIARPEGRLFFVNAQRVGGSDRRAGGAVQPRVVALDMSRVPDIEYSALQMLIEGEQRAQSGA